MSWGSAHLLLLLIQSLLQLRLLAAELSWDVALEQFQVVLVSISTRVCLATSAGYQMQFLTKKTASHNLQKIVHNYFDT
jgi:hypothetical protein